MQKTFPWAKRRSINQAVPASLRPIVKVALNSYKQAQDSAVAKRIFQDLWLLYDQAKRP